MTLVNTETGEIIDVSYGAVRESIKDARRHADKFFEQIVWQVENQVWMVLGYADWDEMREAEYGDMGVVAPRADRPELVSRLRSTGMTQKQIGDTLGVDQSSVSRINMQTHNDDPPATITNSRGQQRPTTYQRRPDPTPEPEIVDAEIVEDDEPDSPLSDHASGPVKLTGSNSASSPGLAPDDAPRAPRAKAKQHASILASVSDKLRIITDYGLAEITELDDSVTDVEAATLHDDLYQYRAEISRVINLLNYRKSTK